MKNGAVKSASYYHAFGKHDDRLGGIETDKHRANTKVENDDGLLNEGRRFRSLEYAIFLTPDPLEYQDGLNFYLYCGQNPWGRFDPLGLEIKIVKGRGATDSDVLRAEKMLNRSMNAKDKDGNLTESAKRMRDVYNNKHSNKLILFRETKEKAYESADDHPSNEGLDRNDPKYTHPGTGNVAKSGEYDGTGHAGDVEINMNNSQWTYADGTKSEIQGAIVHEFSKHVYGYNNGEPRAPKGSAAEAEQERDAVRLENQDRAANGRPIRKAWGNITLSPGELADSKNIKRNPTGEKGLDAPYYKSKSKN